MKRKIILGLTLIALSSTATYAYEHNCDFGHPKKEHMKKDHFHMMRLIQSLDLTHTQREKMRVIVEESRTKRDKVSDAFTQSEFDKSKYIAIMQEKKEDKIQKQAKLIVKVYALLTSDQKKELKNRLDFKRERRRMF